MKTNSHMDAFIHSLPHTNMPTCLHVLSCIHMQCMQAHMFIHSLICEYTYSYTQTCSHRHTFPHNMPTYTYMHTHLLPQNTLKHTITLRHSHTHRLTHTHVHSSRLFPQRDIHSHMGTLICAHTNMLIHTTNLSPFGGAHCSSVFIRETFIRRVIHHLIFSWFCPNSFLSVYHGLGTALSTWPALAMRSGL